jgi:glycosyltransferase involved in cell wall biosynthesis
MEKIACTAIVLTLNEEDAIRDCLDAVQFCDQVLVVDSGSSDATTKISAELGAEVIDFEWNGRYPKKKQWSLQSTSVRNNWVLLLDADEIVSAALRNDVIRAVRGPVEHQAYDIPLEYHFAGQALRHGHQVRKRSLLDRRSALFIEMDDLDAPGGNEVEGHYQPQAPSVGKLDGRLIHRDPDPVSTWIERHNRYSDWEAFLRNQPHRRRVVRVSRSKQGQLFDRVPFKPLAFFTYSFIFRLGFLDGRAGFDYAFALSFYYWLIATKVREIKRHQGLPSRQSNSTP